MDKTNKGRLVIVSESNSHSDSVKVMAITDQTQEGKVDVAASKNADAIAVTGWSKTLPSQTWS